MALLLCCSTGLWAQLLQPTGVGYDATGNLYIADAARHQVFEATLAGQLVLVAGNGTQGFAGDGGAATAAQLNQPQALAIDSSGTLYIADTGNQRIRAVNNGVILTIAGNGKFGFSGDGGPAVAASLALPNALALDATGALLICDSANHRLRRIASGTITTIAGSGTQGFSGDGGLASLAMLDTPSGVASAPDGRLFIADTHNHRVRVVSGSGVLATYAGSGTPGFSGDGGPASAAQLDTPRGLSFTSTGTLLIADENNRRLRSVSAEGVISTIAGRAMQGTSSDGAAALAASLNTPKGVAFSSFHSPVLSDATAQTVRVLAADGNLYLPAALASGRVSTVTVTTAPATFGQATATVTVSGAVPAAQGSVELTQNGVTLGTASLASGTATFQLGSLTAGNYSLSANYLGDGLNPAAVSPPSIVSIGKAATSTTAQPAAATNYAQLPMLLNAAVATTTQGNPTGTVLFLDNSTAPPTTVASAQLTGGVVSAIYLQPSAGTHSIVASYQGDADFLPSTSAAVTANVLALPDFTLTTSGATSQTVAAGAIASYTLVAASQSAPFTGAVSFSVTGLPKGATASFAPAQIVPGASAATTTLSIQTLAPPLVLRPVPPTYWLAFFVLPFLLRRRRRRWLATLAVLATLGCGTRINQPPSPSAGTYPLTVTATGTSLAGTLLTHSVGITLIVE